MTLVANINYQINFNYQFFIKIFLSIHNYFKLNLKKKFKIINSNFF